jgi:hypothetical protein
MTRLRQGYGGQGGPRPGFGGQGKVAAVIAVAVAIALAAFSVVRGTWSVGGSDSSCYALMAKAFAGGQLQPPARWPTPWPPLPLTLAPAASLTLTPMPRHRSRAGHVGVDGAARPVRIDAIFWLTPIAAFVWCWPRSRSRAARGRNGRRDGGDLAATSPIVLFKPSNP